MALRDYQIKALEAIRAEYEKGIRRVITVMPTGSGKTQVFSHLPEHVKDLLPGQTLVLAHRAELLDQAIEKLQHANPTLKVSKEMASEFADPNSDIIVASTATLGRKNTKRADKFNWEQIDKIITDECHHATSQSYQNIYELAGIGEQTHKLHVGFTATPQRGDGQALAKVYQKVAYVYGLRQAIEAGWLVDVRGYRVKTETDISDIGISAGDFQQDALADRVNNPKRNHKIVKAWMDCGGQRQTVAFCVDITHAKALADMFEQNGVPSSAVWGDDPTRTEKLKMLRDGKIKVLCNCAVLTEGFDCWQIGCIILARPTKSPVWFTQAIGRGTRLEEGTGNLKDWCSIRDLHGTDGCTIKKDCIVLDVVDASSKHSLVTLPTLMGLGCSFDLRGQSMVGAVRQIEEMQDKHPSIDFTTLDDIDKMQSFIESVNMFDVRFPDEVEQNSELTWFRSAEGGYRMSIPAQEKGTKSSSVHIFQNMLDKWEIVGAVGQGQFHGVRPSMEEAFKVADEQIRQRAPWAMKVLAREATWHDKPASPQQMALLKKLMPWQTFPPTLGRGQASRLIGERLAGKAKK